MKIKGGGDGAYFIIRMILAAESATAKEKGVTTSAV